ARGHGRIVGVQLLYITPAGEKSLVRPQRRYFALEPTPGVFEIAPAMSTGGPKRTLIAEGAEDGETLRRLGRPARVLALPGHAASPQYPADAGEEVTVCRDCDEPGSPADQELWKGVDALINRGAVVRVTQPPPNEDNNSIWVKAEGHSAPLSDLIDSAVEA